MEEQNVGVREFDECKKEAVNVRFITSGYMIEGAVFKSVGHRFSEYLNSISDDFISLKNAKVYSKDTEKLLYSLPYIGINKSFVVMVTEMGI